MGSFGGFFKGIGKKIKHGWKSASRGAESAFKAAGHQVKGVINNVPRLLSQAPAEIPKSLENFIKNAAKDVPNLLGINGTTLAVLAIGTILLLRG